VSVNPYPHPTAAGAAAAVFGDAAWPGCPGEGLWWWEAVFGLVFLQYAALCGGILICLNAMHGPSLLERA
jgi:hypothetical protein